MTDAVTALAVPKARPRATYQDVLDAPPHLVAEIVNGVLYTMPRPAPLHVVVSSALSHKIGPPFHYGTGGPGGWLIVYEPELHLGEDILIPDLAGWRRERMPQLPDTAYFALAPDWVCEVLSPTTKTYDLGLKKAIYAHHGVAYCWIIDPHARSLEAFVLDNGSWSLVSSFARSDVVDTPPFEAASFVLRELWE